MSKCPDHAAPRRNAGHAATLVPSSARVSSEPLSSMLGRVPVSFAVTAVDPHSRARAGTLTTPHGEVPTPTFMAVGTRATVTGLDPAEVSRLGAGVVLANTYHLWLRPGIELFRRTGSIHRFMGWNGPVLTDSGGYQIFSLAA